VWPKLNVHLEFVKPSKHTVRKAKVARFSAAAQRLIVVCFYGAMLLIFIEIAIGPRPQVIVLGKSNLELFLNHLYALKTGKILDGGSK
jgi:hypothetical protein